MPATPLEQVSRAEQLLERGDASTALALLIAAERQTPLDAHIQRLLCACYLGTGDELAAAAARLAAQALETGQALLLYNLATGYFLHGQNVPAEKWFRVCLAVDPDLATAHQNLAAILEQTGRGDEARQHLHSAYTRQWLFIEPAPAALARVLVTCAAGVGNTPLRTLLRPERFTVQKCMIEYLPDGALATLPEHELVLNAIGDADCAAATDARLAQVLARSGAPLLNAPERVDATRRDRLPRLLGDLEDVVIPKVHRIEDGVAGLDLRLPEMRFPMILRPAKSHGGLGVALVHNEHECADWFNSRSDEARRQASYATAFHDSRDSRGNYRKYRVIYVDGKAYPYHLAISTTWLVHYFSAHMLDAAWKLDEERRFLEDPRSHLGARAWQSLMGIGERLGLDYAGIDFTLLPDGRLLVFEANATMLVHGEPPGGPLAWKNPYVETIVAAFEAMVLARAAG